MKIKCIKNEFSIISIVALCFFSFNVCAQNPCNPVSNYGWISQDIGAVAATGSACTDGSIYKVEGSGADIWGTQDEFHFVYQQLSGDSEIIARVTAMDNTDGWAKAGIMIRKSLQANAAMALLSMNPNPTGSGPRLSLHQRDSDGASMIPSTNNYFDASGSSFPIYIRLVRQGNTVSAYHSYTNGNWSLLISRDISLNEDIFVGLAVNSHDDGIINTAYFDNVAISDSSTPPSGGGSTDTDNLLSMDSWTLGNGSIAGYTNNGNGNENVRVTGTDPYGSQSTLWHCIPDSGGQASGGWNTDYQIIDPNETYRFSVWVKRVGSNNGETYFGLNSQDSSGNYTTLYLSGAPRGNPYFWSGDLPELDKWYLLIGFMHKSGHTGTTNLGGVYDPATGTKVLNATDYKFASNAGRIRHRSYFYYTDDASTTQYFYAPAIYQVTGNEPSISEMMNPPGDGGTSGGNSPWVSNSNSSGIYYNGNVGIGTSSPDKKLVVNGDVKWGNSGATLKADQGAAIELRGTGTPYIDFTNDPDTDYDARLILTQDGELFIDGGNVGIGTSNPGEWKLAVNGKIRAKEIKVETGWADYVFKSDYHLPTLEEVEKYIKEKGHLINIPSADEVALNGIELGEMNKLLLEKIEELTLYILQQDKQQKQQDKKQKQLEKRIKLLENKN